MATPGIQRAWRTILVNKPNVGTDWSLPVGGQRFLRVVTLTALLSTSAAAPARQVTLTASRGGNVYFQSPAVAGIGAAAAVTIAAFAGAPRDGSFINTLTIPLPSNGLLLRPGDVLAVTTGALDAGDQWSAIAIEAEEVPSGPNYEGDELSTPAETS